MLLAIKKNKEKLGSGYIQKFNSGAENISVYLTIKRDAEKAIMQCFKQFGLDPKSEKELKREINPDQGDLFEGFKLPKNNNFLEKYWTWANPHNIPNCTEAGILRGHIPLKHFNAHDVVLNNILVIFICY